mgnify:CR=1 FL=1
MSFDVRREVWMADAACRGVPANIMVPREAKTRTKRNSCVPTVPSKPDASKQRSLTEPSRRVGRHDLPGSASRTATTRHHPAERATPNNQPRHPLRVPNPPATRHPTMRRLPCSPRRTLPQPAGREESDSMRRRSRTKYVHTHTGTRLTFGCAACIENMRFDQACAVIDGTDTASLNDRLHEYQVNEFLQEPREPRRLIAYVRLELHRRNRSWQSFEEMPGPEAEGV